MNRVRKIIFLMVQFISFATMETDYQISVPEFICSGNDHNSGTTRIGLFGEGKLHFKLSFERIDGPCNDNQRCNLFVWKMIRDFEKFLNNYPYAQTNHIEFNNSMLISGLKYIFDLSITQGKIIKKKQFSLDFVDANSTNKPLASISFIGTTCAKAQMPYTLNAKIDSCSNISDYYMEWKLLDHTKNILEIFPERGTEMTIPAFTLQNGKQYHVKCSLINMENDEVITNNMQTINVKNITKNLIVKLPIMYTTMSVQHPITIKPYIVDLGNIDGEMKKEWFCIYENKNICEKRHDDNLNIESGFLDEGEYNISLKVTKGSTMKSDWSIIKILRNVPSIEIDKLHSPVVSLSGVEIKANIDDVRTFCTLQWKSEEGLYFFDLNKVPGNVSELSVVVVKRDLFLNELEEFSNDVTNKEYDLLIPPSNGTTDVWPGLPNKADDYKLHFILETKCPKVQLEDKTEVEYSEQMLNNTFTVSASIEIEVKAAPKLHPLKVEPLTGEALKTIFTFETLEANETSTRRPFLYKFGYILGDREYVCCNTLDYFQCETVLPYIDNGVKTFLEVCNSFNSCAKTFGPIVDTVLPVKINERDILRIFKEKLNYEDFYKAFGYALTILYTSKILDDEKKYMDLFSNEIFNKIEFLLGHYRKDANWNKRANKLIRSISDFSKELPFNDAVINGLVDLRAKLSIERENITLPRRKLLGMYDPSFELEDFKSYLEVSDLIISTSENEDRIKLEKERLKETIKQNLGKLCTYLYHTQKHITLVLKSVILVVEEFPKKSYYNFHVIPNKKNSWNTTAQFKLNTENLTKLEDSDKLCIAKSVYKDYLNKSGVIYEADILNANGEDMVANLETTILINFIKERVEKISKCLVYVYTNAWQACKIVKLTPQYVQCICSGIGSYYLEYEDYILNNGNTSFQDNA